MMKINYIPFFAVILFSGCSKMVAQLPACDQKETIQLVEKIINDLPAAKSVNAHFVSLKNIKEQGFNKEKELRSCAANLISTKGENLLQYSIKWIDENKSQYWVEAQVQSNSVSDEVATDFEEQYHMARKNGAGAVDLCVQAGLVSAGFLQAHDEENYAKWKKIEKQDCHAAGIEK